MTILGCANLHLMVPRQSHGELRLGASVITQNSIAAPQGSPPPEAPVEDALHLRRTNNLF